MSGIMLNMAGVTATSVPGAPTIGTATVSVLTASVPFTAPVSDGGSVITSYTATSSPSGITGTLSQAGSGTITVSGLSSNTAYTFTVKATNAIGQSAASAASNSVTTATVPGAPTIGTATILGQTATVPFTAPGSDGGSTITSYTATSNPGSLTGTLSQAGSGSITVSGLTGGTSYTFTVTATNAIGTSTASSASNSVAAVTTGQYLYCTAGTYNWVAPAGVTRVSVLAVGPGGRGSPGTGSNCYCPGISGGGGSGGGLSYKNNYTVIPGNSYQLTVSGCSNPTWFCNQATVVAAQGGWEPNNGFWPSGGTGGIVGTGGGQGGTGGSPGGCGGGGGAGAAGYGAAGGNGGGNGSAGACGGGGGGARGNTGCGPNGGGGGGGGVGLLGKGSNGAGGTITSGGGPGGGGGSGGSSGTTGSGSSPKSGGAGGTYGGGGGGGSRSGNAPRGAKGVGAIRIIWPGCARTFPSTRTGDE